MQNIRMIRGEFEHRTPESQGVPSSALTACLDAILASGENVHALEVFRHGYRIGGGCAKPFLPTSPRRVYSTMKSVICIAVLFLVQEGKLRFEDRIVDFFPESVPENCSAEMRALTVRNVLNMSVGQEQDALMIFHSANYGAGMIPFTSRDRNESLGFDPHGMTLEQIFFSLPMVYKPGERFFYVNTVPELLIRLVTKASGGTDFINYLRPRLFEPLGTDVFNSQETWMDGWKPEGPARAPYDPVLGYLDGSTTVTSTKDLCKFALFLLQDGAWEGRQLLSPELVREATRLLIPTDDFAKRNPRDGENRYGYGMQIWRNEFGGFSLLGGSGQAAIAVPEKELVIVYNSMNTHLADRGTVMPQIIREFYRSVGDAPLPEDPAAYREMNCRFDAWSTAPAGLSPHAQAETLLAGTHPVAEPVDGITALDLDFASQCVTVFQGENSCCIRYGLSGAFAASPCGPEHPYDGYSFVYGADLRALKASAGWQSENVFVLQLQYDCQMYLLRYFLTFADDGTVILRRED